jgi:uncharacterized protein with von Willebrand factor type A (vWA) domain
MTSSPSPGTEGGFAAQLLVFCDELRGEGIALGTSEILDAVHALAEVSWTRREDLKVALAATLAKSPEDRRVFELVFERFFLRAAEAEAIAQGRTDPQIEGGHRLDRHELRARVLAALESGDEGELRELARLALAALGSDGDPGGLVGLDLQRIRRELDLRRPRPGDPPQRPGPERASRDRVERFERHLRSELERAQAARTGAMPPSRPLRELDRALPMGPLADLAEVHRVVARLKRRLATQGRERRGSRTHAAVDVRRTMRASLETGGVPLRLRYRPRRPRRPELYVLCDVSTSVTSASVFFLSVLHALHDAFGRLRSFVFVERISEVTDVFARERSFPAVSEAIAATAGVADVSGYTDYGRVWIEFLDSWAEDLGPRSTLLVLGDARTNGREPGARAFAAVSERAGRTFWINPEPRLYWNYGDSVMEAYAPWCDGVFECWSTRQLEGVATALAEI